MMSLEEARRPRALLVERIADLIALIETAHERLTLGAVGGVVENAIHQRREAGRKALQMVRHPADDSGQSEQADKDQRSRERPAAKGSRDRLLDQPVSERGERHGDAREPEQDWRGREHAGQMRANANSGQCHK